jgi:hypothetical protein
MSDLVQYLLHLHPASWAQGGRWRLELVALPKQDGLLALILFSIIGIWGVLMLYRRDARRLNPLPRWSLAALRIVALATIVFMLLEPVLVFTRIDQVPSRLIVLNDLSESMELKDAYVDPARATAIASALNLPGNADDLRRLTRAQLARKMLDGGLKASLAAGGDRDVRERSFTGQLIPATSQPAIDRSSTAIGAAIRQVVSAEAGQPLAGILLLTDGQSNSGEPPAAAANFAAQAGVPISSVALGTPEGPRSVKVTKIDVSPAVFVRDPNPLHVLIESHGMAHQPANLVLDERRDGGPWEEIGRAAITLEENGRVQSVPFEFKEDRPAHLEMRARLEDAGPQVNPGDDVATAQVRVIHQKIRVLFIAGSTFPEVEFLRNTLLRDNSISASTWLQTADADYEQPGDPRIKRLPATADELDEFDCVVLYDPDPNLWPGDFSHLLTDFVAKSGGGLIFIAGERNTKDLFDRPDDPAVSWLNLLPVVVEPGLYQTDVSVKLSSREAWKLDVTPEGKVDPIFGFSQTPEQNESILANLPGMYWHFPVTRAKPGATVLARHGDPRMRNEYGAHVLLATQLVGPGRTFFVAFDSTYRWRYLDEQYFDGFWARMIDRAGRSKQLGGRYPYTLSTDRSSYRPGSQVTLTARFDNPADRDPSLDAMHGEVQLGDDPPMAITLSPRSSDPNAFDTTFSLNEPGIHFVRVWTGEADAKTAERAATLEVPVELPNLEFDNPVQDISTLQTIAKVTGGKVFDLSEGASIPDAFKTRRVARTLEDRQEIWDAPLLWGLVFCSIVLEWVLRKRFRLV